MYPLSIKLLFRPLALQRCVRALSHSPLGVCMCCNQAANILTLLPTLLSTPLPHAPGSAHITHSEHHYRLLAAARSACACKRATSYNRACWVGRTRPLPRHSSCILQYRHKYHIVHTHTIAGTHKKTRPSYKYQFCSSARC